MIIHTADPYNAEPSPAALAGRVLTPMESFYTRNHGPVPAPDPVAWRLRVTGLIRRELEFSVAELRSRFAERTLTVTLQCAGNQRAELIKLRDIPGEPWGPGATSTADWTGASLAEVLAVAGVREGAAHVAFSAPDVSQLADPPQPFGGSINLRKALAGEVLLAWAMNGEPLPPAHGAPLRVVVPGYIGARRVKWVDRVTVQDHPSDNYFQAIAYRLLPTGADPGTARPGDGRPLGPLAVNCAILQPDGGAVLTAGPARISGYAVAGDDRGIARVDVSIDGGRSWRRAGLGADAGPWAWRIWHTVIDLPAGTTEILARARDTAGAVQPESAAEVWNPNGYVNNSWGRLRVTVR